MTVDAVPGKAGQGRADPGAALDHKNNIQFVAEIEIFFILDRRNNIRFGPEMELFSLDRRNNIGFGPGMELFSYFFETFFKTSNVC